VRPLLLFPFHQSKANVVERLAYGPGDELESATAHFGCAARALKIVVTVMERDIVGRERELGSVCALLDRRVEGIAGLVFEGEPGIGKSTLWLAGVEYARSQGRRVLSVRPAEAERGLAYVGLGDLFEGGVLDDVLSRLSAPRRRALEAALLLVDAAPGTVDSRALGVAVRDALQVLAEQRPPLVAIDDLQWLDAASAGALAFALRRLEGSTVLLLLARRLEDDAELTEVERALPDQDVERLSLGPLSVGALHAFLRDRVDRVFARQTLLRIHEQSGGNPFYALEVARALGAEVDPTQPLPVPQVLDELVHARVAALPAATREALALAAAAGTASESLLESAGIAPEALAPAFGAGVLAREGGAIRFTHPLLASAVYDASVHVRLARVVEDPLARARHLALATRSPDADIAHALDEAAELATTRGAAASAAELSEHALRLTPVTEVEDRHRRALATARAEQAAGEWTRAQAIARRLLADARPGPQRAAVLALLAEFEVDEQAVPLLEEALAEAAARPELRLRIRIGLASSRRFTSGFAAAFDDARTAVAAANELDDDTLRVSALTAASFLGRAVLSPDAPTYATRAHEIAMRSGDPELLKRSAGVLGQVLVDRGEYEAARASLERDYEDWRELDERFAAALLWSIAWLELWTGNLARAADCAARSYEIHLQYGTEAHADSLPGAWAAAYRGRFDLARELAERGLAFCEQQILVPGPLFPGVLGLLASWSGDAASGVAHFAEADRVAFAIDWRNPHMRPWTADYVEALLELGRTEEAERVLGVWEDDANALAMPRVLVQVARCRGLIAAAQGRVDEAAARLEQVVEDHVRVGDRFGQGRALLALGGARRRQRKKAAARSALDEALTIFDGLGAGSWARRARVELGRIGGRTREPGLTAAERRVAALAAQGRTNREVAAALFLGERTVETHLSHVYAKLGVRSRAELARVYRSDFEAAEQSSGGLTISS
jgi:DNA-binding CsgD family transcriptional regulator